MSGFIEHLQQEKAELQKEIHEVKRKLAHAPTGRMEIKKNNRRVQYYYKDSDTDAGLKYIKKSDKDLAVQIAQRDYYKKVLQSLEKKYKAVCETYEVYKTTDTQWQLSQMHEERRKLIVPRECDLSDSEYAVKWQNVAYQGKVFTQTDPEIYTVKGERVRSKSEKIIADALERMDVPYRYEYPVHVSGDLFIYPDFMVLNKRTRKEFFLEHFGMMDNPEYAENMIRKVEEFGRCGIFLGEKLLMTFETKNRPLNTAALSLLIKEFLL